MPSLEICPLSEHLEDKEIQAIVTHLEDSDVALLEAGEDDGDVSLEQKYDDDTFVDFWDQLDANDAGCHVFLPEEFEDPFEVDGRRVGSAHALLLVLAAMKEDMSIDDEEEGVDDSGAIAPVDDELDEYDDYAASGGEEEFEADDDPDVELREEQMRVVWKVVNQAARRCIAKRLALFVHE